MAFWPTLSTNEPAIKPHGRAALTPRTAQVRAIRENGIPAPREGMLICDPSAGMIVE
jgi:hypothetical protein